MNKQDFLQAIEIIAKHHTTSVVINKPANSTLGNLCSTEFSIDIVGCCANVVNKLKEAGFTLSVRNGAMQVDKY